MARNRDVTSTAAKTFDIPAQLFILQNVAGDILMDDSVVWREAEVTAELTYKSGLPSADPERMNFLAEKFEELSREILRGLSNTSSSLPGVCVEMLLNFLRPFSSRAAIALRSEAVYLWRWRYHSFAVECVTILLNLNPTAFVRIAADPINFAIKSLRSLQKHQNSSSNLKNVENFINRDYEFLAGALSDPFVADIFSASQLKDLQESCCRDLFSSTCGYSAVVCLNILLQIHGSRLKIDGKNQIFSSLVAAVKNSFMLNRERRLSSSEFQLFGKFITTLTTFILSTALHVGILNICGEIFEDGLKIQDFDVQISCRQGLQIISCIVRPRAPKEVFENYGRLNEAATGVLETPTPVESLSKISAPIVPSEKEIVRSKRPLNVTDESKGNQEKRLPENKIEEQSKIEEPSEIIPEVQMETGLFPMEQKLVNNGDSLNEVREKEILDDFDKKDLAKETENPLEIPMECEMSEKSSATEEKSQVESTTGLEHEAVIEEANNLINLFHDIAPDDSTEVMEK